jgi:hypothetical protein
MALVQLIYRSMLAGGNEAVLESIHASALRHNKGNSITGMLLFHKGAFLQVLEGDPQDVMTTYHRICHDTRHKDVRLLVEQPTKDRHFPNWLMGFRHLEDADAIEYPEYAPYFKEGFGGAEIYAKPGIALRMLQAFNRNATP